MSLMLLTTKVGCWTELCSGHTPSGVTALMKAAEAGQTEVVKLLISLNANVEAKDDEG